MGPKKTCEDFIETLLEPRVISALSEALSDKIYTQIEKRLDSKLLELFDKLNSLEACSNKAATAIKTLEKENAELKERLDDLDSYSRSDNLIIHGIPAASFSDAASTYVSANGSKIRGGDQSSSSAASSSVLTESSMATETTLIQFVNNILEVPLSPADISVAHRLPKRPNDSAQAPAPIIVRFASRRARNAVFSARMILKTKQPGVYINEHLTPGRAGVLREGRKLVKERKLSGAWSKNGVVYIKLSDLPDCRPKRVNDIKDLPRG